MKHLGVIVAGACLIVLGFFLSLAVQSFTEPASGGPASRYGSGAPRKTGGKKPTSRPTAAASSVEVAPAMVASIRERVPGSGVLRPERRVEIIARTEGAVEQIDFEEGQRVEAGAVLCHIDERALSLAVSTAEIEKRQAAAEHQRFLDLLARGAASDKEEQDTRFAKERAESTLARAQLEFSYAQPRAPFDGVVTERGVEIGQYLRPGDVIASIADFEPLRMTLFFAESAIARITPGQRVEFRRSRDQDVLAIGHVERVSPVVDETSLTVEVTIDFPNAPQSLRPGSFGVVDIITRTLADAVLVPKAAVLRDDQGDHVFRVRDGRADRVGVIVGYQDDAIVQCREGLEPGDLVVVQGNRDLRDGTRVSVHREVPVRLDPLTVTPSEPPRKTGS